MVVCDLLEEGQLKKKKASDYKNYFLLCKKKVKT